MLRLPDAAPAPRPAAPASARAGPAIALAPVWPAQCGHSVAGAGQARHTAASQGGEGTTMSEAEGDPARRDHKVEPADGRGDGGPVQRDRAGERPAGLHGHRPGGRGPAGGLALRDTVLVVFGNPAAGTPVMAAAPLSALDLPLKFVVWDDGGPGEGLLRLAGDHRGQLRPRRRHGREPGRDRPAHRRPRRPLGTGHAPVRRTRPCCSSSTCSSG